MGGEVSSPVSSEPQSHFGKDPESAAPQSQLPQPHAGPVRSTDPGCLPGSSPTGPKAKQVLPVLLRAQKALASPSDPLSTSPVCSLESPSPALGPLHLHSLGLRTLLPWLQHLPPSRCLSTTAALLLPALCSVSLPNTNCSSQTQTCLSTVPRFERRMWTGVSPASTAMPGTLQVLSKHLSGERTC